MITCDELIDRVRDSVDGVEVDASPDDIARALLRAALTLAGIALRRLDADEREFRLGRMESNCRDYLDVLAEREARAKQLHWKNRSARRHPMTPEAATPNTQATKPDTPAAPVAPAGTRTRQSAAVRFPARFHCAISIPMAESLRRLTSGPHSLLAEADVGRLALNAYLTANDPYYARLMRGGGNGNA